MTCATFWSLQGHSTEWINRRRLLEWYVKKVISKLSWQTRNGNENDMTNICCLYHVSGILQIEPNRGMPNMFGEWYLVFQMIAKFLQTVFNMALRDLSFNIYSTIKGKWVYCYCTQVGGTRLLWSVTFSILGKVVFSPHCHIVLLGLPCRIHLLAGKYEEEVKTAWLLI